MSSFAQQTVLITGGASGIGYIMGRMVLQKGAAALVVWDINPTALEATRQAFAPMGKVYTFTVDISDAEQIKTAAEQTRQQVGKVDILINNAGIVIGKYFNDHTYTDIKRTMDINALAPMLVTQEFLPDMIKRRTGHVCTIASSAGLVSNPKMSVYVASKWAATGWSDSLRIEMAQQKTMVGVTTVTPYYINTGMFDGVKSIIPILNPEKVSRKILSGIERNRIYVSMPWGVRLVRLGQGLFPIWLFDWLIGGVFGIYKTMDHFKGRSGK